MTNKLAPLIIDSDEAWNLGLGIAHIQSSMVTVWVIVDGYIVQEMDRLQ